MARHVFPPESFSVPFSTLPISEISRAWISKRLGRDPWLTPTAIGDSRTDDRIQQSRVAFEEQILGDLRTGVMVAHAYVEATGEFRRIVPAYWAEDASVVSLQGAMFDLSGGQTFPKEIGGSAVIVRGDQAIAWLAQQGLNDTDPFFPPSLRSAPPGNRIPRKTQYDWPRFHDEAVYQLHEQGAFSGDWKQARLEEHMLGWCLQTWGDEPSRRMVRDHVKLAVRRFLREKEGSLGSDLHNPK